MKQYIIIIFYITMHSLATAQLMNCDTSCAFPIMISPNSFSCFGPTFPDTLEIWAENFDSGEVDKFLYVVYSEKGEMNITVYVTEYFFIEKEWETIKYKALFVTYSSAKILTTKTVVSWQTMEPEHVSYFKPILDSVIFFDRNGEETEIEPIIYKEVIK